MSALSFPLSAAAFMDQLKIVNGTFSRIDNKQSQMTGGGTTLRAARAPGMWRVLLNTVVMDHDTAAGIRALADTLIEREAAFYFYDPAKPYPAADPDGTTFGSATPVVGTITDRYTCAFTGFPNSYVLTRGDWASISFDSGRRYLAQFAQSITANGSGAVAAVSLSRPLPASIAGGEAVTVVKPTGLFRLVPDYSEAVIALKFKTLTLTAEQVYDQP